MTSGEVLPLDESDAWLTPRWQQVSNDPVVIAAEQRLAVINGTHRQEAELTDELRNYFWNGRPYSRQLGGQPGEEPDGWGWGPSDPNDPYKFDPANLVSVAPVLDGAVSIVRDRSGLTYLADQDNVLLSQGYRWVKHHSGQDFEIPGQARNGLVHLLSADEQSVVEDKAQQRAELRQQWRDSLQEDARAQMRALVPAILDHYPDIDQHGLRILHSFDAVHIEFSYGGRQVELVNYSTASLQLTLHSADRPEPADLIFHADQLSQAMPIILALIRQPALSDHELARDAYLEVSQPGLLTARSVLRPETYAISQLLTEQPTPDRAPRYFAFNPDSHGVEWLEEIRQG